MAKRIVLCMAGPATGFAAQYFFARNEAVLSRLGIGPLQGQGVFGAQPDARVGTLRPRTNADPLDEDSVSQGQVETLVCFLTRHFLRGDALFPLLERLHVLFPRAECTCVYPLLRHDYEYIGSYAYGSLASNSRNAAKWLARTGQAAWNDCHAVFSLLRTAFGGRARVWLRQDPARHQPVSDGLLDAFGLDRKELVALGADFSPPPWDPFSLPREFLVFCRAWHAFGLGRVPIGSVVPWSTQAALFTECSGYSGDSAPFFSPQKRGELLTLHAQSCADLARELGLPRLFPDFEPEPDWEPFPGLTEETAFKVAERLDRDFAVARMAEFDAQPVHYMPRGQRLCRQALHDALDPPSAAPIRPHIDQAPKLAVLTLTYNQAPYIAECIESVLAQKTNFPFQHIIADDCSDDGAQDIILDYAARYPHIVPVFRKKRSGGPRNIRAMFDMARTEYVALCDGDDYFTDPAKLQSQVDLLDAHKDAALCFHVAHVIYEDGSGREGLFPPERYLPRGVRPFYYVSDLIRHNIIQTNTVMYRWRFKNGLPHWFRTNLAPGDWYWHLLHAEQGKIGFINKVMSVYRRHAQGVYYLSEIDRVRHRARVGWKELELYDVINAHFDRKFEPVLLKHAYAVFMDCKCYDLERAEADGVEPVLPKLCAAYPDFARHFPSLA